MGKKRDIRQIEAIAREFGMDPQERRKFGDSIEDCKASEEKGSGRDGDFTL
jgi:phage terminase small subunit